MDKLEAVEKKVAEVMDALPGYEKGVSFARLHRVLTEALSAIPDERAAIVSWLRGQAVAGDKAMMKAMPGSQLERDLTAGVVAINRAADAIERGDHLKDSHPTPDAV